MTCQSRRSTPGRERTKTGRLCVYAHEQRPWAGPEPLTAVYLRRTERPSEWCRIFSTSRASCMSVYAGFEQLTAKGNMFLATCWA
jgi:transposase